MSILLFLFLIGCSSPAEESSSVDNPSKPYPPQQATENGDVVVNNEGETVNYKRFDAFLTSVLTGENDEIRVTKYTIEGAPIFYNLQFNGEDILYTFDNTEDGYAGSGRGKRKTRCSEINQINVGERIEYRLRVCDSNEIAWTFHLSSEKTSADMDEADPDYNQVFIEAMMENTIVIAPYATDPEASYPTYEIRIDENTRIEGSKNSFEELKVKDDVKVWVRKIGENDKVAERVWVQ
nr:DUF4362 domain-containing protein [Halobacillus locisalis]